MSIINFGDGLGFYDKGNKPSVAVNDSGVVVEIHQSQSHKTLWYHVGEIAEGNTISWGSSHEFDSGESPSVALNDNGVVVEVHKSHQRRTLWYHIGKVDRSSKRIDWGSRKGQEYDKGMNPGIAINNQGRVVEVHETDSSTNYNLWHRTGEVRADGKTIDFNGSKKYDTGVHPAVALNNRGDVIEVHETQSGSSMWYNTGNASGSRALPEHSSTRYDHGYNPSIALDDQRKVVEVHKSQNKDTLWFHQGTLSGLGESREYANGERPSIACSGSSRFVEVHIGSSYDLFYHSTRKFPGASNRTWMTDNYGRLKTKCLYQITLPGAHDAGAYELTSIDCPGFVLPEALVSMSNQIIKRWSLTQNQRVSEMLNGGVRFFDLRIAMHEREFYIHHGLLGPDLREIFRDIKHFMSSVEKELVIISVSHFKGLDNADHHRFMGIIKEYLGEFLYTKSSGSVLDKQIQFILGQGPKIILIYDDPYFRSNPNDYFWPATLIYNKWSDTNSIDTLKSKQRDELRRHSGSSAELFELQWILSSQTSDFLEVAALRLHLNKTHEPTLKTMSQAPNMWLNDFLRASTQYQINIIIVDFYEQSDVVRLCADLSTK